MSRRNSVKKKTQNDTSISTEKLLDLFVYRIMKKGKRNLAYKILYEALILTEKRTNLNPLLVLRQAVKRVTPTLIVKAKRKSGSTYQVPIEIPKSKAIDLAIRWILIAARKRTGPSMIWQLSSELIDAARQTGSAIRKRDETERMAKANKAFAHYR
jgi:small subunit ribosomal protein S7